MKAGPYITAMIEDALFVASESRKMAEQMPDYSDLLIEDAEEAEADARRWAEGTDYFERKKTK